MCYTEKASPTRHRPEHQHNARSNEEEAVCVCEKHNGWLVA